jgi:hypothetical protein
VGGKCELAVEYRIASGWIDLDRGRAIAAIRGKNGFNQERADGTKELMERLKLFQHQLEDKLDLAHPSPEATKE